LSDKQPIIEELTARLRHVAEGEGGTDKGLGLRIVTVQIKEAVVSSARLWENLQKPFRSDRHRLARLGELAGEEAIAGREGEAETQKKQQTSRMETEAQLANLRSKNDAEAFDREAAEKARRAQREQDDRRVVADAAQKTALHAFDLEKKRHAAEAELARAKL